MKKFHKIKKILIFFILIFLSKNVFSNINNNIIKNSISNYEKILSPEENLLQEKAFKKIILKLLPMSPERIIKLKKLLKENEFAKFFPSTTPPKPIITSLNINLSPGITPPVIRLAKGFISSIIFLDKKHNPIKIISYDIGNPNLFNIQWNKNSNVLMIQSLKDYNYGNLAIHLKDINLPVMLTLVPSQKVVDYRIDFNIRNNEFSNLNKENDESSFLFSLLNNEKFDNNHISEMNTKYGKVWITSKKLYFKTSYNIISPKWLTTIKEYNGVNIYEIPKTSNLLILYHGKVKCLKLDF